MKTAEQIYNEAIRRSHKDHNQMVDDYLWGKIEVCSPCGMDRDRQYVIEDFQKVLDSITSG